MSSSGVWPSTVSRAAVAAGRRFRDALPLDARYGLAVVIFAVCCVPSFAPAQSSHGAVDLAEEADLHFSLAVEHYRSGQFRDALEHLLVSNRLVPNHNVVFNVARCYEQLDQYDEAYRHYLDYLVVEIREPERLAATAALERLRPHVALMRVETEPPGATLYVGRRDLGARGQTPRVLALTPGAHTVIVELEGHDPVTREAVSLALGETTNVRLALPRIVGFVRVDGEPVGAEIRVDDANTLPVASLPAQLALSPGSHVLIVEAEGRDSRRYPVQIVADEAATVAVSLPVQTGTLAVEADETGARIEIDGRLVGFTPTEIDDVPAGRHRVRVGRPGFEPLEQAIDVPSGGRIVMRAELRPRSEVIAASRRRQSLGEAPASVTLIGADEIRTFGYTTLYDALGGTRGVFQTDDRTYRSIGVRGLSRPGDYGNRLLVLLDGHPINDDQLGSSYVGFDFLADLDDVRQIERVQILNLRSCEKRADIRLLG